MLSFKQYLFKENLLENKSAVPLMRSFLEDSGRDLELLGVIGDNLEDSGSDFSQAIRLALRPGQTQDHELFRRIMSEAFRQIFTKLHARTMSHNFSTEEWTYIADFNLNKDADPMSRSSIERKRYWRFEILPGKTLYRFNIENRPWRIQQLTRPLRRKSGEPNRKKFTFSGPSGNEKEFGQDHFVDTSFSLVPDDIVIYCFVIAVNDVWWTSYKSSRGISK
jgi:hypothetical protein